MSWEKFHEYELTNKDGSKETVWLCYIHQEHRDGKFMNIVNVHYDKSNWYKVREVNAKYLTPEVNLISEFQHNRNIEKINELLKL